jgi:hypothetical protein
MSLTKVQEAERQETVERLRKEIAPGDTLRTILRHVSRSGMTRHISVIQIRPDGTVRDWTHSVAKVLGNKVDDDGGMKVSGCGMDMGFDVVYSLSRALYGDGYNCLGERCPSSEHSNYRGPYPEPRSSDTIHRDGYAISQRWL